MVPAVSTACRVSALYHLGNVDAGASVLPLVFPCKVAILELFHCHRQSEPYKVTRSVTLMCHMWRLAHDIAKVG